MSGSISFFIIAGIIVFALILLSRKNKLVARISRSILCAVVGFAVAFTAIFMMSFGVLGSSNPVQGWVAVIIVTAGVFLICLLFICKPCSAKIRKITAAGIGGALAVMIASIMGYNIYYNSILEVRPEPESSWYASDVNLMLYEPFLEDTLAKSLEEPSTLKLYENLPRLDGATALYPLYSAFVRAVYPEADYNVYNWSNDDNAIIICSRTSGAFHNLIEGSADLIFLMGVSDEQYELARERGLELKITPIGREAFVFFVNARNNISDLSAEDIRGIYSGRITHWREVGGGNRAIRAYQRPETSGSQVMLKEIMGNIPIMAAPERDVFESMMGMYRVVADYRNYRNSLGYSFRYYINDMIAENEIKFLSIDNAAPTAENIASGEYPFAHDFYAISIVRESETERTSNTERLIEWILSPQGQSLVEKTGYVPVRRTTA